MNRIAGQDRVQCISTVDAVDLSLTDESELSLVSKETVSGE